MFLISSCKTASLDFHFATCLCSYKADVTVFLTSYFIFQIIYIAITIIKNIFHLICHQYHPPISCQLLTKQIFFLTRKSFSIPANYGRKFQFSSSIAKSFIKYNPIILIVLSDDFHSQSLLITFSTLLNNLILYPSLQFVL